MSNKLEEYLETAKRGLLIKILKDHGFDIMATEKNSEMIDTIRISLEQNTMDYDTILSYFE
jgi:hypothetical protein